MLDFFSAENTPPESKSVEQHQPQISADASPSNMADKVDDTKRKSVKPAIRENISTVSKGSQDRFTDLQREVEDALHRRDLTSADKRLTTYRRTLEKQHDESAAGVLYSLERWLGALRLVEQAEITKEQGDLEGAFELYRKAAEAGSDKVNVRPELTAIIGEQGEKTWKVLDEKDPESAATEIDIYRSMVKNRPDKQPELGRFEQRLGSIEWVRKAEVAEASGQHLRAYEIFAQAYEKDNAFQEAKTGMERQYLKSFKECDLCPEMVLLPPGPFFMGSPHTEPGRYQDEGPLHQVNITRPFAIARHETTFERWDACVAAGGCSHKPSDGGWGRGNKPVINVSWEDIREYLDWLSERAGHRYRLPSEARWEFAARAGTQTRYWWGDRPRPGKENCSNCGTGWEIPQPARVGSFEANPFGLKDISGNGLPTASGKIMKTPPPMDALGCKVIAPKEGSEAVHSVDRSERRGRQCAAGSTGRRGTSKPVSVLSERSLTRD